MNKNGVNRYANIACVLVFMTGTSVLFNNCSEIQNGVEFAELEDTSQLSGNPDLPGQPPVGDPVPPENCVEGKRLGVWLDPDQSGVKLNENFLGSIVAYQGELDAAANFNYYSASAHPVVGPTPIGYEAHVFFYEGTDGLHLNFYANVDEGGSANSSYFMDIVTSGNDMADSVVVSDDPGHCHQYSENIPGCKELHKFDSGEGANHYEGRFLFFSNTDGGVIGPFNGDNYDIQMKVLDHSDINGARFYGADGSSFSLQHENNVFSSLVIAYYEYETCE